MVDFLFPALSNPCLEDAYMMPLRDDVFCVVGLHCCDG
jgi:hypothetical protein